MRYCQRMALTKTAAETHLDAWLAADLAVSKGLSYSIAGRSLTRENSAEIRDSIAYWQNAVDSFEAAALGVKRSNVMIAVKTR